MASDVSSADPHKMVEGSSGAGFEVSGLSGDELAKILPDAAQMICAKYVLGKIILESPSKYDITAIEITDYSRSLYQGEKIEGKDANSIYTDSESYTIKFTATRGSDAPSTLFENSEKNTDLLKEIGIDNLSQEGAVFTVEAKVTKVNSNQLRYTFEQAGDDFVLTERWNKDAAKEAVDADVTYKFKLGTVNKSIDFSTSRGSESSSIIDEKYDFLGVPYSEVTELTRLLIDRDISQFGEHNWNTVKYGDNRLGVDAYVIDPQADPSYVDIVYANAAITSSDLTIHDYHLYGDSGICIFTDASPIDPSLHNADALKTYINAHGSYSDGEYEPAKSAADGAYKDVSYMDELKLALIVLAVVIGVVGLLFLILIIVVIILIVKRKKR